MITVVIVGASGYAGAELVRILSAREDVTLQHVIAASSAGKRVDALYPSLAGIVDLTYQSFQPELLRSADVVFCALPSGESMQVVPQILRESDRVIDLSGDFRLPTAALYEEYYHHEHVAPALLASAVYGLPELFPDEIAHARLVANPGCYPTSVLLALAPALREGLVEKQGIVINSLSGVSGAGRAASLELSFSEINENIRAYKIGSHQHIPEVRTILERVCGADVSFSFVPHLVPVTRGIYTTIHAGLCTDADLSSLYRLYESFYAGSPFVRMKSTVPQIHNVVRSNFCDIHLSIEPRTRQLIIVSVIDNLMKGAAGQAVQNMNMMFGLPQHLGLLTKEIVHV